MHTTQANLNPEIAKTLKLLKKKNHTDFILNVSELLAQVMREKYYQILQQSTPEKASEIKKVRDEKARGRKDEELGLGLWIGIYSDARLFERATYIFFTAENLNNINSLRKAIAHPRKTSKRVDHEVCSVYVCLVNILRELGYIIQPESHKLCQICITERATKKFSLKDKAFGREKHLKICDKCHAIISVLWKIKTEKEMKMLEEIFELRCMFDWNLENSYKKYLPKELREFSKPLIFQIVPETKDERRRRLTKGKKLRKMEVAYEELKKDAMLEVYQEETQKKILLLLCHAVKEAVNKGPEREAFRESALNDCETGLFDVLIKIMEINKRSVFSDEELKTLVPKDIKTAFHFRLRDKFSEIIEEKYGIFIEVFIVYSGVEYILDTSRPFFKALSVMGRGDTDRLFDSFGGMFTPKNLDEKKLTEIVKMIISYKETQ